MRFLPTSPSEHTAKLRSGVALSCVHSVSVCERSARLGTRKSTRLPAPATRSAICRLVNVLPVPHAMMSLPRSNCSNPFVTCPSATSWCGRSAFFARTAGAFFGVKRDQSMTLPSSAARSIFVTGVCWSRSASSACSLQSLVVVTMRRRAKGFLPDAVKKLSMSAFAMRWRVA